MTPSQIISIARDAIILVALGFIVFWIYRTGEDRIKVADMQAVQNQLAANTKQVDDWKAEEVAAEVRRDQELDSVNAAIKRNAAPIWMCQPPNTRPVSTGPARPQSTDPPGRPVDPGPRTSVDIRPQINALEQKYEAALADCRKVVASWPH